MPIEKTTLAVKQTTVAMNQAARALWNAQIIRILWHFTTFYGVNAFFCYVALFYFYSITLMEFLLCSLAGIFLWTFLEYFVHRWLLHPELKNPFLKKLAHYSHLKHHEDDEDPHKFFVPLSITMGMYFVIAPIIYFIVGRIEWTIAIIPMTTMGYVGFEWFHYWVHVTTSKHPLTKWYRKYHFAHHYKNEKYHYGVTTPIWDIIFRTTR